MDVTDVITTFVEYDGDGELFHVCQVETTEGHLPPPGPGATADAIAAHEQAVADAIAASDAQLRDELAAHIAAGKRLLVLPAGADVPERGRTFVDIAKGNKLTRRTDAQLTAWQHAEQAKVDAAAKAAAGGKP